MAKKLIGYYENPKPEDAKKIAADAKAFAEIEEAKEKGCIFIGSINKDSTEEDRKQLFYRACEAIVMSSPAFRDKDDEDAANDAEEN